VFVDDTELDFGEVGTAQGRAAVEKFFRDVVFGELSFSQHLVYSPLITFSGPEEAEGKWHFLVPCTFRAAMSRRGCSAPITNTMYGAAGPGTYAGYAPSSSP
jgi:hypothetical protein